MTPITNPDKQVEPEAIEVESLVALFRDKVGIGVLLQAIDKLESDGVSQQTREQLKNTLGKVRAEMEVKERGLDIAKFSELAEKLAEFAKCPALLDPQKVEALKLGRRIENTASRLIAATPEQIVDVSSKIAKNLFQLTLTCRVLPGTKEVVQEVEKQLFEVMAMLRQVYPQLMLEARGKGSLFCDPRREKLSNADPYKPKDFGYIKDEGKEGWEEYLLVGRSQDIRVIAALPAINDKGLNGTVLFYAGPGRWEAKQLLEKIVELAKSRSEVEDWTKKDDVLCYELLVQLLGQGYIIPDHSGEAGLSLLRKVRVEMIKKLYEKGRKDIDARDADFGKWKAVLHSIQFVPGDEFSVKDGILPSQVHELHQRGQITLVNNSRHSGSPEYRILSPRIELSRSGQFVNRMVVEAY